MKKVIDYINETKKNKTIQDILLPIFRHISDNNDNKQLMLQFNNDGEELWNRLLNKAKKDSTVYDLLVANNIHNFKSLTHWLYNHKDDLSKELTSRIHREKDKTWWQSLADSQDKQEKERDAKKKEEQEKRQKEIIQQQHKKIENAKSVNSENTTTKEDIVLYLSGYPKQFKTTKYYTISFRNEEERNEKINALKHEWKEKTGENISDCNVINKENYMAKYKNLK